MINLCCMHNPRASLMGKKVDPGGIPFFSVLTLACYAVRDKGFFGYMLKVFRGALLFLTFSCEQNEYELQT
jgi:hypothetical protein